MSNTEARSGGDNYPLLPFMVSQEAGCKSFDEFADMDGLEYQAWLSYVLTGPSQVRTQILLAQLVQMVGGALGGRAQPIDRLLPYHQTLTGENTAQGKEAKRKRVQAIHQSMVDDLISKKVKR